MSDRRTTLDILNLAYEVGALTSIPFIHRKVHDGELFAIGYRFEAVDNNAAVNLYISVGSDKEIHGVIRIKSTGKAWIDIQEEGEYSSGDAITAVNFKRSSAKTLDSTFKRGVTIDTPGDNIGVDLIPGSASPARSFGGDARPGAEFNGAVDSEYVIVVTNKAGAAADIFIELIAYESEEE